LRLVFVGSPPFGTPILERLAHSAFAPELVLTPPARARGRGRKAAPQPLAERACELGLEVSQPATVREPEVMERLAALAPDVILVASYGEFLRREFLDLPRIAPLNVHPSLLPRHRGATPIPATILHGDEVSGVTIQRIAPELDAGDVLIAREAPVLAGETAGEMTLRLAELSGELSVDALQSLADGSGCFTPQDHEAASFCKKLEKEDGRIDWALSAVELERRVRAFNPWPGAHTSLPNGKAVSVWRARVAACEGADHVPGQLVRGDGELVVATGEGALALEELQVAGKRAMAAGDFQRGARLEPGTVLGMEAKA